MKMLTDKELKKKFKPIFSDHAEKYYPIKFLKSEGFFRGKCEKCGKHFWSQDKTRKICGDSECIGQITLFSEKLDIKKQSYAEVWYNYCEFFKKRDYVSINRYPVVARWNATVDFTIASIAAFQPFVVSGEVEPPADKLVIPQFCLRFGDIDNVGVTGSHCTGFVMIGQHAFVSQEKWNQEQLFQDIYEYLINIVKLPKNELILHEDAWAGGGNYGPCVEFFSRGIELFNQVYMMFEHHEKKDIPLKLKILDMGLGMERIAWFTQRTTTMYDAVFPQTIEKLKKKTGVKFDLELYSKFAPYASLLNVDEAENIDENWKKISEKLNISLSELKNKIEPMTAIYSIAEHTRTLLVAITDGGLPSNTGGGYNLRVILRRALNFINKYKWNTKLSQVAEWNATELKELFPELEENIKEVKEILDYETEKYYESLKRNKQTIENLAKKNIDLDSKMLLELYDSKGITPYEISEQIKINIPKNFYALVSDLHEKKQELTQTKVDSTLNLEGIDESEILYFDDYSFTEFNSIILKIEKNNIILDKTAFYPTSGGQLHDKGKIKNANVIKVFKQKKHIVHVVDDASNLKEKEIVHCIIDFDRRLQLAQHHTATHIVNGASRMILGNHIWQAGASKTLKKARLDITHYKQISKEELQAIEELSNKIISDNLTINSALLPRHIAEEKYGFRIYQGGAVPGKVLRIIEIPEIDVEACGGTHLNSTSETAKIRILKTSKLQDSIVRIEFTAGQAAVNFELDKNKTIDELEKLLNCTKEQIPGRVEELFNNWKQAKKLKKKNQSVSNEILKLHSENIFKGDILIETAKILKTQKEHITKTVKRFLKELKE